MFNGDFNPADDFIAEAGYERGLFLANGANIFNPSQYFRFGAVVTELLDQEGDCRCIARLDRPNDHQSIASASRAVIAGKTHIHDEHIRMARRGVEQASASECLPSRICRTDSEPAE